MNVMVICGTKEEEDRAAFAAAAPQEVARLLELQGAGALVEAWSLRGPATVLVLEVPMRQRPTRSPTTCPSRPLASKTPNSSQ
jgi:hypothetical protein